MARALSRKKGGRRAPLRKRAAKKRPVARKVQRKPRKLVHRKRAPMKRKVIKRKSRAPKKVVHRRGKKRVAVIRKPKVVKKVIHRGGRKQVQERVKTPAEVFVTDPARRKQIVKTVIAEIRNAKGYDLQNRFRDMVGNTGLQNISLKLTTSASGAYIGYAMVNYNGEVVKVFIKMFISDDLKETSNPAFSLLTEACISKEISEDKYSNIPTLMQNYGVLYSTIDTNDFYGNINFDLPSHTNIVRVIEPASFHPVYFISEISEEYGTPAVTLNDFIIRTPTSLTPDDYIRSLFFEGSGASSLRKDVFSVFVQLMLTVSIMHKAGLYHNDLHSGNVFVVKTSTPINVTFGNITIRTNHFIRIYDWDRGFSGVCNPLITNTDKFMSMCQSVRDPVGLLVEECYSPHENVPWGDFWMVLYSFALGMAPFGDPKYNDEINGRVGDMFRLLTTIPYTGNFWEYNHNINFEDMINNLKPEYIAQITI